MYSVILTLLVLNIIRCTILLLHRNSISTRLYRWLTYWYRWTSCTTRHFLAMTSLVCLTVHPPPPLLRQIYTYIVTEAVLGRERDQGGEGWKRERGKACYKNLFLNYSFHLFKHWQHLGITRLYIRLSHKIRPPFWQIVLYCFHTLNLNTVQFTMNLYIF